MRKLFLSILTLLVALSSATAQNYTITAPAPGAVFTACQDLTISYTKSVAAPAQQAVEISFNEGKTFFEVARLTTTDLASGSVTIPAPNKPTTKARVRVRNINTVVNAGVLAANFTITPSLDIAPFAVTGPAGPVTYPLASTQRVTWTGPTDRTYNLSYSLSATGSFLPMATVTGRNYYDWNLPNASSRIYVRVQDAAEPCRVAFSDTLFRSSGATPAIGLTSFNGGEAVISGQSFAVTWNSNGAVLSDTVIVSISYNNGVDWTVLDNKVLRTGPFLWVAPNLTTTQALFRIEDKLNPGTTFDISNSTFNIKAQFLALVTKTVSGTQTGCQNYDVAFNAGGITGFYQILLTTNGGESWYQLSPVVNLPTVGLNTISVLFPSITTTTARLLVVDAFNPALRDTSNPFSIVAGPAALVVTNPTTGQFVNAGQTLPVNWTTTGAVPTVDVAYSTNGGFSYITFATGIANTGTTNWTAPVGQNSNDYVIRVSSSTTACVQAITNTFQVSNAGVVGIIFPVGGEQFLNGQTQTIRWEAAGLTAGNQVAISYSTDGGATYTPIATVPNTGSYNWLVPVVATSQARIRVADASNPVFAQAVSPGNFQIIINFPPVIAPGFTIFLTLPANSVTILTNVSDPENDVLTFSWSQVSGPSAPTLSNIFTGTLSASPLVAGVYVFALTVKDTYDATAIRNFTVQVNPAPTVLVTAWKWIRNGTSTGDDRGNRVVADGFGNAYVVGSINQPTTFGGVTDVTTAGARDAFIAKYDSTGAQVWIRLLGNTQDDEAQGVALLPNGNLVITGWFNISLSIPGTTVITRGGQDMFLASITPSGDWVWLTSGGSSSVDQGTGVAVVGTDIYVGGWVSGNAVFGPVATTGLGSRDALVAKYSMGGMTQWARVVGSSGSDMAFGVSAAQLGTGSGVVLAGFVSGPVTIGAVTYPTAGGRDAFTYALMADGSVVGFRLFGGTGNDQANQVLIGPDPILGMSNPRTYVVGAFQNTMALPGGATLVSAGGDDAFVLSFDLNGTTPLAFRLGRSASDGALDIAITGNTLWVSGYLSNRQPGGPASLGAIDGFVARYNLATVAQLQLLQVGGISVDFAQGIAPSVFGSLFVTGKYKFTGKFGPYEIGGRGNEEMFVGRITNTPLINFRQGDADADAAATTTKHALKVMPNPAQAGGRAQLVLEAINPEAAVAMVRILDVTGRQVSAMQVQVMGGLLSEELTLPQEAGVYLIRVEAAGQGPTTARITVQ